MGATVYAGIATTTHRTLSEKQMSMLVPSRRRALGDFLRSRRNRLTPAQVGIAPGGRRRAPGLRREEIAQLAGVSVTWYTWLEQGRDITASHQVLESLARELQLSAAERRHLFSLAGTSADAPSGHQGPPTPALHAMIESLDPNPAYLLDAEWNLVAWNRAEAGLIGDPAKYPVPERNLLRLVFTEPRMRTLLRDWSGQARNLLAQYRADIATRIGDPVVAEFVAALRRDSTDFTTWWEDQPVAEFTSNRRVFDHPEVGELTFDYVKLAAMDQRGHKLFVCMPADAATAAKLPTLVSNC